jgi:hypothetical protein
MKHQMTGNAGLFRPTVAHVLDNKFPNQVFLYRLTQNLLRIYLDVHCADEHAETFHIGFDGILQTDRYPGYNWLTNPS